MRDIKVCLDIGLFTDRDVSYTVNMAVAQAAARQREEQRDERRALLGKPVAIFQLTAATVCWTNREQHSGGDQTAVDMRDVDDRERRKRRRWISGRLSVRSRNRVST